MSPLSRAALLVRIGSPPGRAPRVAGSPGRGTIVASASGPLAAAPQVRRQWHLLPQMSAFPTLMIAYRADRLVTERRPILHAGADGVGRSMASARGDGCSASPCPVAPRLSMKESCPKPAATPACRSGRRRCACQSSRVARRRTGRSRETSGHRPATPVVVRAVADWARSHIRAPGPRRRTMRAGFGNRRASSPLSAKRRSLSGGTRPGPPLPSAAA